MPEQLPPLWALVTVVSGFTAALVGGLWLAMAGLSLLIR